MATVLVMGASRGLGFAFVEHYVAAGDRVIATARDDAGLARLRAAGVHQVLRLDVAQPASVSGLAWQLDGEAIDLALYVAGVIVRGNALSPPTREDFDRVFHTNVLGAMQAIPQVAPLVEAAGGTFAFISSTMGRIDGVAASEPWTYRASKAALNMAVASAQHDYPRATLVALSPGWVQTDMGGAAAPLTVDESVAGMRATLAGLGPDDRGAFLLHDGTRFPSW
ncbi:SDR family oxidoreductase [uncultured Xylophilus sp.]|uniref:SDR family oxidoreductase n=1 Tax=uncultured Xylophilus sp. TaxID=296832 RepID=UPI0025FA3197|nr:SDR family oxidoreductase [uncultured Xylophilus sp.]